MKQAINPVVAVIVIVVAAAGLIFWLWKGTGQGGSVAPGGKGNASPFGPGGAAVKAGGGASPENQSKGRTGTGGPPGYANPGNR